MPLIKSMQGWQIPEREAAPEYSFLNRRKFLKSLGLLSIGTWATINGCVSGSAAGQQLTSVAETIPSPASPYPLTRNTRYQGGREITDELIAASYNNYYEFTTDKDRVWRLAHEFETQPWSIQISGAVENGGRYDMDDLLRRLPLEERVYRHRCVEAWSMVVPWSGFTFASLINLVQPTAKAKYVRMIAFKRPDQAPGQRQPWYPWPYYEGLTMQEAMNELTFLVTGIYGHALPKQHGAPLRLAVPWKYGFKSIKGIVAIEFLEKQPATFWNDLQPNEYGFTANVDPGVPHPRWSQATERDIHTGNRIPTQLYNGYEAYVAHLYKS